MTAPALILLAEGAQEPRAVEVIRSLRKQMQVQRPELPIHLAFLDHCPPTGPQVITTLATRGVREAVFVPMSLTRAIEPGDKAETMLETVRRNHPEMNLALSHPIGPAVELLNILDLRLRNALSACHALELDGLVLATPELGDVRGSALVARRARQWGSHHKLPVAVASADGSGNSITSSIMMLREQGRRAIAVGSLFLTKEERYTQLAEQAMAAGAVAVSSPIEADDHIIDLIMARYAFTAMEILDSVPAEEHLGDDVLTSTPELVAL